MSDIYRDLPSPGDQEALPPGALQRLRNTVVFFEYLAQEMHIKAETPGATPKVKLNNMVAQAQFDTAAAIWLAVTESPWPRTTKG